MAVSTLVATAGSASANTYCSLASADQFHEDRPPSGTAWADATSDEKNAALLFATKMLDALFEWTGWPVNETQALLWPRTGMWYRSGYYVPSTIIPQDLQDATAEYARQLLADVTITDNSDVETQGITQLTAGPITLRFKDSVYAKAVPDTVVYLLPTEWYRGIRGRRSATVRIGRS